MRNTSTKTLALVVAAAAVSVVLIAGLAAAGPGPILPGTNWGVGGHMDGYYDANGQPVGHMTGEWQSYHADHHGAGTVGNATGPQQWCHS